jgi:uncharacterized protein YdaU (DUF1376 family)
MASKASPAFQFYVNEWKGSRPVQRMSYAERGIYLEMLLEEWERFDLPDSAEAVADLIATTDEQRAEVLAAWPKVRARFVGSRRDGRIVNLRLERVRAEQRAFRRGKQKAGSEGGKAKARNRRRNDDLQPSSAVAVLAPAVANPSSLLISSDLVSSDLHSQKTRAAGHRKHAYCGARFCVPSFLHEQFDKQLGSKGTDRFDLLAWYPALDTASADPIAGEVLDWLRRAFADESKRRLGAPSHALGATPGAAFECRHTPRHFSRNECRIASMREEDLEARGVPA